MVTNRIKGTLLESGNCRLRKQLLCSLYKVSNVLSEAQHKLNKTQARCERSKRRIAVYNNLGDRLQKLV